MPGSWISRTIFEFPDIVWDNKFLQHNCDPMVIQRTMVVSSLKQDKETADAFFDLTMNAVEDCDFQ
jgi:hypothetical protein